jgi:hypothetical protein
MSRLYSRVRQVFHFIDNRQFHIFQFFESENCRFQVFGKEKTHNRWFRLFRKNNLNDPPVCMKELEKSQWFWTPFFPPQNFENHGYLDGQGVSLFEP